MLRLKKKDFSKCEKKKATSKFIVEFQKVEKSFFHKGEENTIFKNLSFKIARGQITAILGSSGAGKTTVARIINGLIGYDGGKVLVDNELLCQKTQAKIRKKTAFVFQNFNLFPHMTVLDNITYVPIKVYKQNKEKVVQRAEKLLKQFLLDRKAGNFPHELSGGQKQRVAIIRALMLDPEILIMDEPTASLDPELTHDVIEMIKTLNKNGLTIIIITHDIIVAKKATHRIIMLHGGHCVEDMPTGEFFDKKTKKNFYATRFLANCE